ncbi:MAG: hypothetical protein M3O67_09740, partial [Bacteroidota bacterium]|nr:hypothetical protein [Bacteroidota bacterium]
MKTKLIYIIQIKPVFLYLLPLFFVLHGFTENYDFVPVKDLLLLTGRYLLAAFCFSLLFRVFLKSFYKANLFSFFLLTVFFFFGSFHDTLKELFASSFVVKYKFLLPFIFLSLLIIFIYIKKIRGVSRKTIFFLNTLFSLFILADVVWLTQKIISYTSPSPSEKLGLNVFLCDSCNKPDIYLIVTDEYAGLQTLKEKFNFDNSAYVDSLRSKGFYVLKNSFSNYNFTNYSMASALNMSYLPLHDAFIHQDDWKKTYAILNDNRLVSYLAQMNYATYNYSIFPVHWESSPFQQSLLPTKTQIFTSQTLLYRLRQDLGYHLTYWKIFKGAVKDFTYVPLNNNIKSIDLTKKIVSEKTKRPKFVYTHLTMPHYPYYFNKNGDPYPYQSLLKGEEANKEHYLEYLQYGNKILINLVDTILKTAVTPPVIILFSDHGFRFFADSGVEEKYAFPCMNAVHI